MEPLRLLDHVQRLQALAQAGLTYTRDPYDRERYEELRTISVQLLAELTNEPIEKIIGAFASEQGYPTPKVDVRAVVIRDREVLLVKESLDGGKWTLPGGWADIGFTPFEMAAKEVLEETGLVVRPMRLLALFDKRKHAHPPQPWYTYKAFIQCEVTGGSLLQKTLETGGARWFQQAELRCLELSVDRTTAFQLEKVVAVALNPEAPVLCD